MTESKSDQTSSPDRPLVLFDGECRFCNSAVNFIIDRDRTGVFHFAPLQSELGCKLVEQFQLAKLGLDSVVLIEGDRASWRSTASLRIARQLPLPWRLAYGFIIVPAPIRDFAYRCFAKVRYRLFGKQETCRVPTPELRARFLA